MKQTLIIILYLLSSVTYGQDNSLPTLKSESSSIKGFAPKDWFVLDSIRGDLNKDLREDVVFILQRKDSLVVPGKDADGQKILLRVLAIAFRAPNERYVLTETNHQILIDDNSPPTYGPSFNSMEIENNVLILQFAFDYINGNFHFYTYRFHFQKDEFLLIGAESKYVTRRDMNYETAHYNFLTSKWSRAIGIHSSDEDSSNVKESIEWFTLHLRRMRTLESMGRPGSWEISKDRWL